jgi:hypothetical protein
MLTPNEINSFIQTDKYLGLKKIISYSTVDAMNDMFKGDTKELLELIEKFKNIKNNKL